jgi:hypothetical protein
MGEGKTMAIVLQPKYPIPNRSKQKIHFSRDEDGVIDIGWCDGVFSDGRNFRAEMWAQDQISILTIFFSRVGIDDVDAEAITRVMEAEGLITFRKTGARNCNPVKVNDDAENPIWSVNIMIGNEDESYLESAVPIFPYSRLGEPNTMFNPVPIKTAHQGTSKDQTST